MKTDSCNDIFTNTPNVQNVCLRTIVIFFVVKKVVRTDLLFVNLSAVSIGLSVSFAKHSIDMFV